jgi:hypothetical protein
VISSERGIGVAFMAALRLVLGSQALESTIARLRKRIAGF